MQASERGGAGRRAMLRGRGRRRDWTPTQQLVAAVLFGALGLLYLVGVATL